MPRWSPSSNVGPSIRAGSGVGDALNDIGDSLGDWQQRKARAESRNWEDELNERRYVEQTERYERNFQQQADQDAATARTARQRNAVNGVYDELDPEMTAASVDQYDPNTGQVTGQTSKYRSLGGDLGYQDVTRQPGYQQGVTAHGQMLSRQGDAEAAGTLGMDPAEAGAWSNFGGQTVSDVLEGREDHSNDLERDALNHTARDRNDANSVNRRATETGGVSDPTDADYKAREATVSRQIDDTRQDLGDVADVLDPDSGISWPDTASTNRLQGRLDSLTTVRDDLSARIGGGAGHPTKNAEMGQEAITQMLPELNAQRDRLIQRFIQEGKTQQEAEAEANKLYTLALKQYHEELIPPVNQ